MKILSNNQNDYNLLLTFLNSNNSSLYNEMKSEIELSLLNKKIIELYLNNENEWIKILTEKTSYYDYKIILQLLEQNEKSFLRRLI
jgi:hypothetical protein